MPVCFEVSSSLFPLAPIEALQRGPECSGQSQQHGRGDHQRHEDSAELCQRGGGGGGVLAEAAAGVQAEQEGSRGLHVLRLGQRGTCPSPGRPDTKAGDPLVSTLAQVPACWCETRLCPDFLLVLRGSFWKEM